MNTTDQFQPVQPPSQHTVPPKQPWPPRKVAGVTLFALAGLAVVLIIVGAALSSRYSDGSATQTTAAPATAEPSPAASTPCTTDSCIATDAETLKGTVAKDNSVITEVACKPSTVDQVVSGTYTVHCAVSYSA